ncbi:MAG: CerR family C-terminal domain-containing protein, partial [Planctomycetota bacterium]
MAISQQNSAVDSSAKGVRGRLLDSAEQLFAERGFDGTSIRDLAAAAGCNIASVNYYFGGKEKLYVEIWRRHLLLLRDTRIAGIDKVLSESGGKPDLEDLLRSFAYSFIGPLVDESGGPRLIRLMAREMLDPHLPPNMFAEDVIMPTLSAMQNALARACPGLPDSMVPLVVFSLVGQLLHTIRFKTMLGSMDDETLP